MTGFSPSTGCFYPDAISYPNPPHDLVVVPDEDYSAAMARLSGQRFDIVDGRVVVTDNPPPSRSEIVAQTLAVTRQLRSPIMSVLDGMQVSALTLSNTAQAQAIETAKQALRDITQIDLSGHATRDQMAAAVYGRYSQIRDAMPSALRAAFAQVVQ